MTPFLPSLLTPEVPLSVSGLNAYLQDLFEQDEQLQQVWVTGEVSSASRYRSGLFFTLQDPDNRAALQCVVWNSYLERLVATPEPGEQLILLGRLQIYAQRGQYQLIVWQSLPGGEGLRALRYRQLRSRLVAEGLFDPDRKQPLPAHPRAIAVVTSPQAAAWGDIQRTLRRRYPGLSVLFSPALVQGAQAPTSIVQAIERVIQDGRANVLILSRGGGASEDLDCFNDERVVRAIAACPIPVIAGIGHQRDETLADLAADVCAHTPTAAAEQAVPQLVEVRQAHDQRRLRLQLAAATCLDTQQDDLHRLRIRLRRLRPDWRVQQEQQRLQWLRQRLTQATARQTTQAQQQCQLLRQKLATLDPTSVLRRGYAVVRDPQGAIARHAQTLVPGDVVEIQLGVGTVYAQVVVPPDAAFSAQG